MWKIRMETSQSCMLILAGMGLFLASGFGQGRTQDRSARLIAASRLAGTYTRIKRSKDENQSAILDIKPLRGGKIKFHLTALWWPVGRSDSTHNGEIEAIVALHNQVAVYKTGDYRLTMRFRANQAALTESGSNPDFGVNVSAAGTYRRANRDRAHEAR